MPKNENWERVCELEEFLDSLDKIQVDRASFRLGEYDRLRACRVQDVANSQARSRLSLEHKYDENWFDSVGDDDALCWAIGGEDHYVDILTPLQGSRPRSLLPGATPLQYDRRNTRLRSVALAARGKVAPD